MNWIYVEGEADGCDLTTGLLCTGFDTAKEGGGVDLVSEVDTSEAGLGGGVGMDLLDAGLAAGIGLEGLEGLE